MIKESGVVERDSNLEMLIRDLRPFVDKPLGSVRIDMNEVRSILKMHDQQATLIAELQAGMCNGCGSTRTDEQCRKEQKSCCPDRKMLDTAAWRTRALAAESSLHRVRGERAWQPIETAPKDNKDYPIQVCGGGFSRTSVAFWTGEILDATHWAPMLNADTNADAPGNVGLVSGVSSDQTSLNKTGLDSVKTGAVG